MTGTRTSDDDFAFVSTGHLPDPAEVRRDITAAYDRYRANTDGQVSDVYPALAEADPDSLGICVTSVTGAEFALGDADVPFTIMSVAKPFIFALMCQEFGATRMRDDIGVNATGLPFNSLDAVELWPGGRTNPMVNAGALATASRAPGATLADRWEFIRGGLSRFAGHDLELDEDVLASALQSNQRNREIVVRLVELGQIDEGDDAIALYTRACCLAVTARDLAAMGATLAAGGVNPRTNARVVDADVCHSTLAVMATAGMYETSGDWLYDVGLPGKSGIGGGIVTVAPGKGALSTFAPRLDAAGNSVNGRLITKYLSRHLGLDVFASRAES